MYRKRLTGHNVIQLIYPLRINQKNDSITEILASKETWKEIHFNSEEEMKHEDHIHSLFPKSYHTPDKYEKGSLRNWIDNKTFLSYFHPSVRQALFNLKDKKMCVFRRNIGNQFFNGTFFSNEEKEDRSLPSVSFEWISSEIYVFSQNSAFLTIRISLLEQMQNNEVYEKPVIPLELWMKFNNRIRQNYEKYSLQSRIFVTEQEKDQKNKYFFDFIKQMIQEDFNSDLALSSIQLNKTNNNNMLEKYQECLEPNAFIHSFVQSDLKTVPFQTKELYQLTMVDDYEGESGGNTEFQKEFLESRVYKRWAPDTFYTAVDYGAMTIAHSTETHYSRVSKGSSFPDIFHQHHCRQYLILILLQLYYRDELMEIMGNYSNLESLSDKTGIEQSRNILTSYYNLNQHFFFDRLTHEIQGIELWHFYQKVLDTKRLYKAVQEDMRELNSRLIETESEKQNENITLLTIVSAITGMLGMNILIDGIEDVGAYTAFRNILPDSIAHFLHVAVSILEHAFNVFVVLIVVGIVIVVIKNHKALFRAFRIRKRKRKGQHS